MKKFTCWHPVLLKHCRVSLLLGINVHSRDSSHIVFLLEPAIELIKHAPNMLYNCDTSITVWKHKHKIHQPKRRTTNTYSLVTEPRPYARITFKTKRELCETLIKTGPLRENQRVLHSLWLWHMCMAGKNRPLEVHIKEHRYNLIQGLLEESKSCIWREPSNML
jgi:hypothetical protein